MSKHTPGNWYVGDLDLDIVSDADIKGNIVCEAPEQYENSMAFWRANARLIAAAPELLESLKAIDQHIMYLAAHIDLEDKVAAHACLDSIRAIQEAAIRKVD